MGHSDDDWDIGVVEAFIEILSENPEFAWVTVIVIALAAASLAIWHFYG